MPHVVNMQMIVSGREAANQIPQPGFGFNIWIAMIFCGEEIGEETPPMQLARAMPRIRHGPTEECGGNVRSIG